MKKNIITVSREFGSGGRTIGKTVAERLGVPCYDKELVKHVALESGFDPKFIEERGESAPGKHRFAYAFLGHGTPGVMGGMSASDFLWTIQYRVIQDRLFQSDFDRFDSETLFPTDFNPDNT